MSQVNLSAIFETMDELAGYPVEGKRSTGCAVSWRGKRAGTAEVVYPARGMKRDPANRAQGRSDTLNSAPAGNTKVKPAGPGNENTAGVTEGRKD